MKTPVIWMEGLIGSGKTTLSRTLAEHFHLRLLEEPVDSNPYLEKFYADPKRWAFPMQMELLYRRYAMQKLAAFEATAGIAYNGVVLDRGMPGDRVFCRLHMESGNIDPMEWGTYQRAYDIMACSLTPPSLLIFLDVEPEIALYRVQQRARSAEVGMDLEYLRGLKDGYERMLDEVESGRHAWAKGMEILRVPWNQDHAPLDTLFAALRPKFQFATLPAQHPETFATSTSS